MKRPFYLDIPYQDPAVLFAAFADQPYAVFLDSATLNHPQARYSFIAIDPIEVFDTVPNLFDRLSRSLESNKRETIPGLPPFQGGIAGYFGYELLHQLETIPTQDHDAFNVPDAALGFYDVVCAFDHQLKKAWIISQEDKTKARNFRDRLLDQTTPTPFEPASLTWQSPFSPDDYQNAVQQVIDYILAGDIFQANLTQRFSATLPVGFDRYAFYQNLRRINPAPFAAFMNYDGFSLASSSPERFIRVENHQVETCPIKGTRPRLQDPIADQAMRSELAASEKDRAENTMIVDLLRNDLSRVCVPHSIQVPELCVVHDFASVHHLISTVTGTLHDECDTIDLLKAGFPGGSITGAPKVRAMEVISEIERSRRGPYCGAMGYIGIDGTMDTNIVIRTLLFKDNQVCAQVGGGIVADSNPAEEYQETLDKAAALFRAFKEVAP